MSGTTALYSMMETSDETQLSGVQSRCMLAALLARTTGRLVCSG